MRRLFLMLCLVAAGPAVSLDLAGMSDAERAAFRAEVRAYLLENPEVLVEAINVLDARKAQAQASNDASLAGDNAATIFADGRSWVGGNPEGSVTLVEFFDYRCSYCKKAHAEVAALVEGDGQIRYILKEFPILGDQSVLAARFAIAVRTLAGPETYWTMHDRLMTFRGDISDTALDRLATDLGLDPVAVHTAMASPEVMAEIDANHALGDALQISGTPAFVLQDARQLQPDTMIRGYIPADQMREAVQAIRLE